MYVISFGKFKIRSLILLAKKLFVLLLCFDVGEPFRFQLERLLKMVHKSLYKKHDTPPNQKSFKVCTDEPE